MKKLNYAVLGGGGYVGSVLCRKLLEQGNKVVCMDNFHKGHCDSSIGLNTHNNYEFVYGNIQVKEDVIKAIKNSDIVINLAAIVGLGAASKDKLIITPVNVGGVQNIVDCMIKEDNRKRVLVQASTDSIFGIVEVECNEETKPNPQSIYGTTKLEAEKIILKHQYVTDKFKGVILRFSTGCGIGFSNRVNLLINDLVFTALKNKAISVFQPDVNRSFIHVSDMARALIYFGELAYNNQNAYDIYCIGEDSMNYTKRQLAELVKEKTNCVVFYVDNRKDIDGRDYKINHKKMYDAGFKCLVSMNEVIDELIKTYPSISWQDKFQ